MAGLLERVGLFEAQRDTGLSVGGEIKKGQSEAMLAIEARDEASVIELQIYSVSLEPSKDRGQGRMGKGGNQQSKKGTEWQGWTILNLLLSNNRRIPPGRRSEGRSS